MMRLRTGWSAFLVIVFISTCGMAGNTVLIRAVEASNQTSGIAAGLNDVASALQRMSYTGYVIKGTATLPLPAGGSTGVAGYSVSCQGPQNGMTITVKHGGRQLLSTTANLRDGKPLILGGFPSGQGIMVLILLAR